jgi:hypothetical protein
MNKNLIIGILVLVAVSTSVFAYYQHVEVQRFRILAMENEMKAVEMGREADRARAMAEQAAREALKQHKIAIEQSQIAIKNEELARKQSIKSK